MCEKKCRSLPLFGSTSTISRFGERFCDCQYKLVSFLFAVLILTVSPYQPFVCLGARAPVPYGVGTNRYNCCRSLCNQLKCDVQCAVSCKRMRNMSRFSAPPYVHEGQHTSRVLEPKFQSNGLNLNYFTSIIIIIISNNNSPTAARTLCAA